MLTSQTAQPGFIELYTPKLLTVLRDSYRSADLKADLLAGLMVAIVALSMAIAIASGVTPDRGLYTSIIGGFIISAFGGSRFQIGGPAGAFIVLVTATVQNTASTACWSPRSCRASSCCQSASCEWGPSSNSSPIR